MSKTEVSGKQLKDGSVQRVDLDVSTTGQSVIAKVVAGDNISIGSTGGDVGTGDVTINLGGTVAADIADLQSAVSTLQASSVEGDVAALDVRVTAVETDVATLQSDVVGKVDSTSLATVATSGSYSDLTNKPSLFSGSYSDLTEKPSLFSGSYIDLTNKPTLFDGAYSSLTGSPSLATVATSGSYSDLSNKPTLASFATVTTPTSGQYLKYNGSAWVNSAVAYADVTGKPSLAAVATSGSYSDLSGTPTIPTTLAGLTGDVTITSPSNTQVLQYNGTKWVNAAAPSGGSSNLDGLSDVAITSVASGQFLVHDGTNFVNTRTISAGGSIALTTNNSNGTAAEFIGTAGYNGIAIKTTGTTGVPYLSLQTNNVQRTYIAYWGDGQQRSSIGYDSSTDVIHWWTGGANAGRVAIATTSPAGQFHVSAGAAATKVIVAKGAASQTGNLLECQNSSGTALSVISSDGHLGIGAAATSTARINLVGASQTSSDFSIVCKDSGSNNQFYVRCDGLIYTGLSTSSPYNNTSASAANVYVASNGLLYRSTSSLKYKTDVQNTTHGLADVMQLRSVTYKGKSDGNKVFGGLIAEEVHAAGLIEFVQYADDGTPDALAYGNMVSLAFKAIQELNAKVDALQAEKEALEARIVALESK